jgi:hypothetical protein
VREVHLDGDSAARAEPRLEAGVMRRGDRADDGQAESVALRVAGAVGGEPLKRLEQLAGLVVRYRQWCATEF